MVTRKRENGTKPEPSSSTLNTPIGERHHWRIKQLGIWINEGIRGEDALLKMLAAAQSGFDPPADPRATSAAVESAVKTFDSSHVSHSLPPMQLADMSKVEPISWLWKHRYAKGVLHVLSGEGGRGKGLVLLDLAARLATGTEWPDGTSLPKAHPVHIIGRDTLKHLR